mmetsp:Transcript_26105/g.56606  ORF Transcript_26105/g.56606 Transcript_26105/m.56606 type:complete len:269 (-) Transcript_26105:194-1000(-)
MVLVHSPKMRKRSGEINRGPKKLNATRLSGVEFGEHGLREDVKLPPSPTRSPNENHNAHQNSRYELRVNEETPPSALHERPIRRAQRSQDVVSWQQMDGDFNFDEDEDEDEDDTVENWNWSWTVAGLGNAIPNKLREIHMLLLEDDVPAPDELVKPIEGLMNQGLEAINVIGRTALAVGNSVDNAIEGALTAVQNAGDLTMRATASLEAAFSSPPSSSAVSRRPQFTPPDEYVSQVEVTPLRSDSSAGTSTSNSKQVRTKLRYHKETD